ncbi:hypothetical protein [Pseudomonas nitroreducens]|uniref:hypothetical protein n=1 Tax=Pseudomonas nitroreducens TaxID=46680 RepID=UPI0004B04966
MLTFILELLGMLMVILVAAELFTNALEHFGERWVSPKASPARCSPPSARRFRKP